MSILQDLYGGEIFPAENIVPHDPEYRSLQKEIHTAKEYIIGRLSPEDNKRLDHLYELIVSENLLYAYAHFAYGFKLGVLLMQEVITGENRPGE